MGKKLVITDSQQLRIHHLGLNYLRIFYCLPSKLRKAWLAPPYWRNAQSISLILRNNCAYWLLFSQKEWNLSVIYSQSMNDSITIVDRIRYCIAKLLIKLIIRIQSPHR